MLVLQVMIEARKAVNTSAFSTNLVTMEPLQLVEEAYFPYSYFCMFVEGLHVVLHQIQFWWVLTFLTPPLHNLRVSLCSSSPHFHLLYTFLCLSSVLGSLVIRAGFLQPGLAFLLCSMVLNKILG